MIHVAAPTTFKRKYTAIQHTPFLLNRKSSVSFPRDIGHVLTCMSDYSGSFAHPAISQAHEKIYKIKYKLIYFSS